MPTAFSSVPRYAEIHVASCSRRAYHREWCRHATLIALAAPPVPYLPQLRALAPFGRRPVEFAERLVFAGVQKLARLMKRSKGGLI
jgi:hypothetical protein